MPVAAHAGGIAMVGRILRSVDFERVLQRPSCARSTHFAIHFLPSGLSRRTAPVRSAQKSELSTALSDQEAKAVDELTPPQGIWLGSVVPKRHAKRAVTRNLLKRQIRQAVSLQLSPAAGVPLAHGLWVVRLRTPFDKQRFSSSASDALREAAAEELSRVLSSAARHVAG